MKPLKNTDRRLSIKSPSFKNFASSSPLASFTKSMNRSSGTLHEILLQEHLKKNKLKFEKNPKDIQGKPDIVFRKQKLVIFCDGNFWHGRNWRNLRQKLSKGPNAAYWRAKILSNIKRDTKHNKELLRQGWKVLRFWESDIIKNSALIVEEITKTIKIRNSQFLSN